MGHIISKQTQGQAEASPVALNQRAEVLNCAPAVMVETKHVSGDIETSKDKRHVLVLYTGGTIGMLKDQNGRLAPSPGYLESELTKALAGSSGCDTEDGVGSLPDVTVRSYAPLIDSAEMIPADWNRIGTDIARNHDDFDGFVVIHGTDTMTYTASALSFMLEGLNKTVVVTGSQLPWASTRTDAKQNMMLALMVAGSFEIPEVLIVFHNLLLRGNRSVKADAQSLSNAFISPNMKPLGIFGLETTIEWPLITALESQRIAPSAPPGGVLSCHCAEATQQSVCIMRMLPGFSTALLSNLLSGRTSLRGLILEVYGSGTVPSNEDLQRSINELCQKDVIVVVVSQCFSGAAHGSTYAAGGWLADCGVVCAGDMTSACVYAKLIVLLSHGFSTEKIKGMLRLDLRGEITVAKKFRRSSFRGGQP